MFKVTRVMLSEEEIKAKVYEIAKKIEKDYQGEDLLIVGILKGASVFCSRFNKKYRFRCKYGLHECIKLW